MKALLRNWLFSWSTILLILSFILIPLSVRASDISDAIYVGTVRVHNDNTTATVVSTNMSLSTQNLIDRGYMAENATNTALYTHLGVDTAYMPSVNSSVPWSLFVPSIAGYTQLDYKIYMGGATDMGSKLAYFPGATGMTAVDNATLELGDNFTITDYGYFDTTAAAVSANITDKPSALRTYVSGTGNITASITGGPSVTAESVSSGEHTVTVQGILSGGAAGWLTGYSHRQEFTIAGSTNGTVTNYQMPLTLRSWQVFTAEAGNPIISPAGGWEGDNIYSLSVLTDESANPITESGSLRGYYNGWNGSADQIGTATSANGIAWTKYGSNPIITNGSAGQWDSLGTADPSVVLVGSTYYLYYTGVAVAFQNKIGLATATDPEGPWTKYGSGPVLASGYDANEYYVSEPSVIYEDGTFKMWYDGWDNTGATLTGIYYATSADGISWTRHGRVIAWGVGGGISPAVKRFDSDTLVMAAGIGGHAQIVLGEFRSTDGLTWTLIDDYQIPIVAGKDDFGQISPDLVRYSASQWNLYYGQATTADWFHNRIGVAIGEGNAGNAGLNLHSQTDFDDIRFTTDDGTTELDYWLESKTDNQTAAVWIEFDSVAASPSTTTFYLYYGNSGASSGSSGADTFIVFDDFERGVDTDPIGGSWTINTGTPQISTDHAYGGTRSAKFPGAVAWPNAEIAVTHSENISIRMRFWKETAGINSINLAHGDGAAFVNTYITVDESLIYYDSTARDTGDDVTPDVWQLLELNNFDWVGTDNDIYLNGAIAQVSANMSTGASLNDSLGVRNVDTTVGHDDYVDDVIVRNYTNPEPTWGTWGDEEPMAGEEGTGLSIYIDGVLADLTAWTTGNVTDNANTWTFVQSAATPYVYYHKIWNDSGLVQYIEWEYDDTTFTDLSGYGQDATPSFRTSSSDADVWAELLNFGPIDVAESPGAGTSDPPAIVDTPTQPSGMYTELSVTLPGATMINAILDGASIPRALFWFPMFMLFILLISFATHWGTRSTVMKAVVLWLCFMFVAALGGWGWWILIPFAVELWAAVIAMKKIGW